MKIAQLIPSLLPTGPVQVSLDLTSIFKRFGHEVDVFYFDVKDGAQSIKGAKQISFKKPFSFEGYDIVHSHGLRPDLFLKRNRKTINAPIVTTLHNYVFEDLKHEYNSLIAFVFSKVWNYACSKHSVCVVLSNDMKSYYSKFWKNRNLKVIYNTRIVQHKSKNVDLENKMIGFKRDRVLLGSMSSVNPRKGLIQILPLLKSNPNYCWVHFGTGKYLDELKSQINNQGLNDQVWLVGFVENAIVYSTMFDVLVMPSLSEGFPLALLEAVQQKVPTITSNIPIFREVFTTSEVLKFSLFNTLEMEKAVRQTLLDKNKLTENASRRFESEYAPEIIGQKYLSMYKELLEGLPK